MYVCCVYMCVYMCMYVRYCCVHVSALCMWCKYVCCVYMCCTRAWVCLCMCVCVCIIAECMWCNSVCCVCVYVCVHVHVCSLHVCVWLYVHCVYLFLCVCVCLHHLLLCAFVCIVHACLHVCVCWWYMCVHVCVPVCASLLCAMCTCTYAGTHACVCVCTWVPCMPVAVSPAPCPLSPLQSAAECSSLLRTLHGLEQEHLRRSLALQQEEDFAKAHRQLAIFQRSELHSIFFTQIQSAIFKGELKPEAAKMLLQDYSKIQVNASNETPSDEGVIFLNHFRQLLLSSSQVLTLLLHRVPGNKPCLPSAS